MGEDRELDSFLEISFYGRPEEAFIYLAPPYRRLSLETDGTFLKGHMDNPKTATSMTPEQMKSAQAERDVRPRTGIPFGGEVGKTTESKGSGWGDCDLFCMWNKNFPK